MGGHVTSGSTVTANKSKKDAATPTASTDTATSGNCEGCSRPNHSRASCRLRVHPDFNKEGPWAGSAVERSIRAWDTNPVARLSWSQRADGTPWEGLPETQSQKKKHKEKSSGKDYYGGSSRGNNDGDRRGNDGGGVAIQFKCTYNQYRKLTVWHTPAKRKEVLEFPLPANEKALLWLSK